MVLLHRKVWEKLVKTESNEWLFWQEARLASSLASALATQCLFIGIGQAVVLLIPLLVWG